jgi:hypothetical protein
MPLRADDPPGKQLAARELDQQVVDLKREGLTFVQIGTRLGKSTTQIHRIFHRAIAAIPVPAVEAFREQHLARLELMREHCLDVLGASHWTVSHGHVVKLEIRRVDGSMSNVPLPDSGPGMAAIDRLLKIEQEEAKLLGIYPDARFSVETTVNYRVEGVDMSKLT